VKRKETATARRETLTHCLFQEPWWLEAVAPGAWQVAEVRRGGHLVARMPYLPKRKMGMTLVTAPKLTPVLGPCVCLAEAKAANRLSREHALLEELLRQLPTCAYSSIPCHPNVANMLPFHWNSYASEVRYTCQLRDLSDPDAIWAGFRENIRREVRKAERQLDVRNDLPLERFWAIHERTIRRARGGMLYSFGLVRRIDDACSRRNARKVFFAVDAQDRIHAVNYLVWDERCAYYLMGGSDPELRGSGAVSLLMWHAIRHAARTSAVFDFEGSMIRPIERFFRAFGGTLTPYYRAVRMHPGVRLALAARSLFGGNLG